MDDPFPSLGSGRNKAGQEPGIRERLRLRNEFDRKGDRDEIGSALPDDISIYTELDPEMFRAYRDFRTVLLDQGVIPRKDKLLMVLALLTALHEGEAMHMYAEIARNEGATGEEVRDAMRVGILFSGGPGIVAASGAAVRFGQD